MGNLYSTIDILKRELNEKNYVIRSLLNKSNIANCICKHDEKLVETSSTHVLNKSSANQNSFIVNCKRS